MNKANERHGAEGPPGHGSPPHDGDGMDCVGLAKGGWRGLPLLKCSGIRFCLRNEYSLCLTVVPVG